MAKEKKFDEQSFIRNLEEKGVNKPCSRCGGTNFSIIDGYSYFTVNEKIGAVFGGTMIPAVLVVCTKCGAIVPHALGVFESINEQENVGENN